ncbi:DUF2314 domain-containing protein [Pyxidicoccus fallax]|uniref:DUF2314 domain-containing protein n=2 Tax=Pyxidicoccus fallax TaxID=394095 RepID=A0A848LGE8_9BACT|nr:DUF2314 domain-containing protein [Pyxidicoccus fallax]NPC78791.1 DUF2314 domain-containing protein [Pyxidicoccus fallax]
MQRAMEQARKTFRFFWRELAWEQRRIVPALELSAIKVPFRDPPGPQETGADVEEMWVGEVDFDGRTLTGLLLNSPHRLRTIQEGDRVEVPWNHISDWMYVIDGRVYGAYTVNLLRSRMPPEEREAHDEAWGFDFGDPGNIQVVPASHPPQPAEHPMALNMGPSLRDYLKADPQRVAARNEKGFTLLHDLSLAGTKSGVGIALEHGADPNALTGHGMSPLQLANALGWEDVAAELKARGAR